MDKNEELTFSNLINKDYEFIKNVCKKQFNGKDLLDFEDILHDTILKCLDTLGDKKYSVEYLRGYMFKSFKINVIRYYKYSYNKCKSNSEIYDSMIVSKEDLDSNIDYNSILDYVESKYGDTIKNMLVDKLHGYTLAELDAKYNTNVFYQLKKVTKDLKGKYHSQQI